MRRLATVIVVWLIATPALAKDPWPETGGGGGIGWFNGALQLFDQKMAGPINQATYEYHPWSMMQPTPFETIDAITWADLNAACTIGTVPSAFGRWFVYDFGPGQTCLTGVGGGSSYGLICGCTDKDGVSYQVNDVLAQTSPHFWSYALTASALVGPYATDLRFIGYPKPMARLDFPGAGECATVEALSRPVVFQPRDNPVFYVQATPWNWNAQLAFSAANLQDTIAFIGWKRDDVATATPGFNFYIDPAGSGVNALIEAELVDAFGFMWVDSKWYVVFVKDGSIVQSDLVLDPAVTYGSLSNYITQHMGGSIAFLMQTDIDAEGGGRRRGAYQVTNFTDSTNFHSTFNTFTIGSSTVAGPDSGYQDVTGVGQNWHRVISACQITGSAQTLGRFFVSQMDVIK